MAVAEQTKRRWWRRERTEDRALTRGDMPPIMLPSTLAGEAVTPRGALSLADAYAAVRRLADTAASLPLHVYRRTADGGRERADNATSELLSHPAPAVTQAAFICQLVAHLNLFGETFIAKYRDGSGEIQQLGIIAADRVGVEVRGGMPLYTVSTDDGRFGTYSMADIIHVKGLSIDGLRGVSPVKQAREALGLNGALAKFGSAFMANGARPFGILKVPPGPAAEEVMENLKEGMENLKEGMEARHQGASNAGRIAVLSGEISFEAVSMPLADAEFVAQREFSTAEVARIFGLFPWMLGVGGGDSLTYTTVAEQLRAFVMFSLRPWLVVVEQALAADADLFPPDARSYPMFEIDALLRADAKTRAEVYVAALDPVHGWMTREEVRRLEDLPAERTPAHA